MIAKCIALTILLTATGSVSYGAGQEKPEVVAVHGVLMDKACSAKALKDTDPYAAASKHTRTCALMGPCAGSGFGVVTEAGKFIKLDAKGDEQAKALLEESSKKDQMTVSVDGIMNGEILEVKSIKEN
ncbi:MAG: hypothetical protein HY650_15715 [Acidobacteria bacterium]|nr:hypothetical protein [Acidobacteriota bacterium]